MSILDEIVEYVPYNTQEELDKKIIIDFLKNNKDGFYRENLLAHMTASAWVLNKKHDKLLMAYHNIYDSWSWLGGHCDGDEDCLNVAIKEVKEEAGISDVKAISEKIFSLEVLAVDSHYKKGKYVPTHLHLNLTYLLEADDKQELTIKDDENSNVAWFEINEAVKQSNEKWFRDNIYSKLNNKLRNFYENN